MPSTPVIGNGRERSPFTQEAAKRFAWLTEKRLISALSAKQEYEVKISKSVLPYSLKHPAPHKGRIPVV